MFFEAAVLLVVAGLCSANNISYTNCGPDGSLVFVDVTPCPSEPCIFIKGTNMSVTVNFKSVENATALTTQVYGIVLGQKIPFPNLPNPNGCIDSGMTCPLVAGNIYTYRTLLPVMRTYPNIRLVVQWDIRDNKNNFQFCFQFPVTVRGSTGVGVL
ncbi:hypothetical protein ScPMuIL_013629 [Solemya velum]